jgi:16S rRNA (uracil1498-N3)-methyltransferase
VPLFPSVNFTAMADVPLFFYPEKLQEGQTTAIPEDTAKHIGQVLRMQAGEAIQLTDGKGMLSDCRLTKAEKKRVEVFVEKVHVIAEPQPILQLAIGFTRNASRNEWLLEKATELGIRRITPLITERSAKERIRPERWNAILTSAMLQSKQSWLPQLDHPTPLDEVLSLKGTAMFMAHCMEGKPRTPIFEALKKGQNVVMMIGPEGDFSPAELTLATAAGAIPVSLGTNRLRTETAALAAITHFYLLNHASAD